MNGKETDGILISATVNAWIECKNQKREREREREREKDVVDQGGGRGGNKGAGN